MPDWNPEFLNACVTQEAHFFFVNPLSSDCLQPSVPVCLSPRQSIFVYTLPALTNSGAKKTTNYIKKAAAVTDGLLQHFKPCVLGFDTVCSGMLLGALWLSLLGFWVQRA